MLKDLEINSIRELLREFGQIRIPEYQRPYKWTEKNVTQLIQDIHLHKDKSAYRIGTMVFHQDEEEQLNIVDGQQRFITILLIIQALRAREDKERQDFLEGKIPKDVQNFNYPNSSDVTRENIKKNYKAIQEKISLFNTEIIQFFLEKCQIVRVVIDDLSEAFQFFDSQNARGKDLEPHDLLKAFHLREMQSESMEEKMRVVAMWEAMPLAELSKLFSVYLYRVRKWINGESAGDFNKSTIDAFKGVPTAAREYPFARAMHIVDLYVRDYNRSMHSAVHQRMPYPFQLDQPVINGARFFEMIAHYFELFSALQDTHELSDEVEHYRRMLQKVESGGGDENLKEKEQRSILESWKLNADAVKILHTLATYGGRWRTGDRYIRVLFDCCLAYYVDKFGIDDISSAINTSFRWAYEFRLTNGRIGYRSINNRASASVFKNMRDMTDPHNFALRFAISVDQTEVRKLKYMENIERLFPELNKQQDEHNT